MPEPQVRTFIAGRLAIEVISVPAASLIPHQGDPVTTSFTFDTEFMEDGVTIELLSIGIASFDGREYYAEPAEADRSKANPWVVDHVLPYLTGPVKPRAQIAEEIREFVGPAPKFYAWYASYDWVALCQLYGTMLDLPSGWPMYVRDFRIGTDPTQVPRHDEKLDGPEHHALSDARWLRRTMLNQLGL